MVPITSLWLPILLSAVFVFAASAIIHMLLPYHRNDFDKVPAEDEVMGALRGFNISPGEYIIPHAGSPAAMKDPAFVEKVTRGPVVFMTVMRSGPPTMGKQLAQWFVYCVIVSIFGAYIAGRALGPGAAYLDVFRFAGGTTFIAYGAALWQNSIWFKRKWSTTLKSNVDSLVYALLTAGTFGWLWPR